MRAPSQTTLLEAWTTWEAAAQAGSLHNRSGDAYKPSVIRSYETSMRLRILPTLGAARFSEITRIDLQDLADSMRADGLDASTIRNTFMPLRTLCRRALGREIVVNPTAGLELPAVRGRRERIASPVEAAALISALPEAADRAVWATAFYAGLRRGELRALRQEDVDLGGGVIHVRRSWDKVVGPVEPKSRAGVRKVPIVGVLRGHLAPHLLRQPQGGGLFFGNGEMPLSDDALRARAAKAWAEAKLSPIGLHEARHSYASLAIAAGVNAKALSTYMGHSSITTTLDRYGHLMPGNETEAVNLLDLYLNGAQTGAHTSVKVS
jgi:integrase